MKLIIGLGNPGKEYEKTRHNAGFLALSDVRCQMSDVSEWKFEKKFNAETAEGKIDSERFILAKPQTFMNKSGEAAGKLARFYKTKPRDVWVIHDDLDLPLGTLRIKHGGSSGGHRGVQSVIDVLGADFVRFRIGTAPSRRRTTAEKFVLQKFTIAELKKLQPVLNRTAEAISCALTENLPKAMSLYNR